jgi:hypothetical protein
MEGVFGPMSNVHFGLVWKGIIMASVAMKKDLPMLFEDSTHFVINEVGGRARRCVFVG